MALPRIETLYIEHHSWLQGWLRRRLSSTDLASDLAQETFVNLITARGPSAVEHIREPRPFLATIARRLRTCLRSPQARQ